MTERVKKPFTVRCQSGRILLMIPTAVAVSTVALTTLIAEWTIGQQDFIVAWQLFLLALGLLLLMLPAFLVSAFLGKPLCTANEEGITHKGRLIRWTDIESMEYAYGYTRYYGDHTCVKIRVSGEEIALKRGPIWLPLYARRYTTDFSASMPHLKRHFLKGFLAGLIISVAVVCIYLL